MKSRANCGRKVLDQVYGGEQLMITTPNFHSRAEPEKYQFLIANTLLSAFQLPQHWSTFFAKSAVGYRRIALITYWVYWSIVDSFYFRHQHSGASLFADQCSRYCLLLLHDDDITNFVERIKCIEIDMSSLSYCSCYSLLLLACFFPFSIKSYWITV